MLATLLHQVLVRGQYRLICLWTNKKFHLLVFPSPISNSEPLRSLYKVMGFPENYCFTSLCNISFLWCTEANQKWFMSEDDTTLALKCQKAVQKRFNIFIFVTFWSILMVNGKVSKKKKLPPKISWYYLKWPDFRLPNRTCIPLFNLSHFCNVTLQWLFCKTHLKMENQGVQIIFGYTVSLLCVYMSPPPWDASV